jgi:hypothetical protein
MKTFLWTAIATVCLNLSLFVQAVSAGATELGRRVTVDVTNASPQYVCNLLAQVLQCKVKVDPALKTPL